MAYRGDVEALKARQAKLERELTDVKARAQELRTLGAREGEVAKDLAEVRRLLEGHEQRARADGRRAKLPVLEEVRVAAPCSARWDDMIGDAQVRFCTHCEKNVYNLSEMTRVEAEGLLREREGSLCVRLYQRADGTVLTADCKVGVRRRRVRRVAGVAVGGGVLAAAASGLFAASVTQGEMQSPIAPAAQVGHATMGAVAFDPEEAPPQHVPTVATTPTTHPRTVMGAIPPPAPKKGR